MLRARVSHRKCLGRGHKLQVAGNGRSNLWQMASSHPERDVEGAGRWFWVAATLPLRYVALLPVPLRLPLAVLCLPSAPAPHNWAAEQGREGQNEAAAATTDGSWSCSAPSQRHTRCPPARE